MVKVEKCEPLGDLRIFKSLKNLIKIRIHFVKEKKILSRETECVQLKSFSFSFREKKICTGICSEKNIKICPEKNKKFVQRKTNLSREKNFYSENLEFCPGEFKNLISFNNFHPHSTIVCSGAFKKFVQEFIQKKKNFYPEKTIYPGEFKNLSREKQTFQHILTCSAPHSPTPKFIHFVGGGGGVG